VSGGGWREVYVQRYDILLNGYSSSVHVLLFFFFLLYEKFLFRFQVSCFSC
jgi:hypothetical protein